MKDKINFTTSLPVSIIALLDTRARQEHRNKNDIIEEAVRDWCARLSNRDSEHEA